jgi:hypothetical protein
MDIYFCSSLFLSKLTGLTHDLFGNGKPIGIVGG